MSLKALTTVWEDSNQEGGNLLIMLALADYADDNGYCWPAVKTLAKKARLSERQTQRVLKDLIEAGEIEVYPNTGPNGVNKYRVTFCRGGDILSGGVKMSGVTPMTPKPSLDDLPNQSFLFDLEIESVNHASADNFDKSKVDDEAAFESFWKAYPKKVGKQPTRSEFKRRKCAAILPRILDAIAAQKNGKQWQGGFIVDPVRWIRNARWEDEIEEVKQASNAISAGVAALKNRKP